MSAYVYGRHSKSVLITLHPCLRKLVAGVLPVRDHKLLRGVRNVEQQREYVEQGLSLTMDSRHLPGGGIEVDHPEFPELSYAVDLAPFMGGKVVYRKREVAFLMGLLWMKAHELGIRIRWGGDWDSDGNQVEHALWDGVHVELVRGLYA